MKFDLKWLKPGMILHCRGTALFSKLIIKSLSVGQERPCWGSHDAIVCRDLVTDKLVIGESLVRGGAQFTSLEKYEKEMAAGKTEVMILTPLAATIEQQHYAYAWWTQHVLNTPYDLAAFPRLLGKALLGDWIPTAAGWEWANWCTEGVANAYKAAGCDVWKKVNPTPYTTEKRWRNGEFIDVTRLVFGLR